MLRPAWSHLSHATVSTGRLPPLFWQRFTSRRSAATEALDANNNEHSHELKLARDWLAALNTKTIPRHIGEVSFSRSGGPGGQNVNKVNTKATLKVPLQSLLPLVPPILHSPLRTSRYTTDRSQSLVIQSDEAREQAANVESCYEKLYRLLESMAKQAIPGETTQAQREHVQKLKRTQNEARIRAKKLHSSKKGSRRAKYDD